MITINDLKDYTSEVKDLEMAIYTHKQMMKEHSEKINNNIPEPPTKRTVLKPIQPTKKAYGLEIEKGNLPATEKLANFCIFMGMITTLLCIFGIIIGGIDFLLYSGPGLWISTLAAVIMVTYFLCKKITSKKALEDKYNQALKDYEKQLTEHKDELATIEVDYKNSMEIYEVEKTRYTNASSIILKKYEDSLILLENALNSLYDKNIIYKKYRNLVAITTINEYLESGRCSELEGPNGAYNLYENEIRQNRIIEHLSSIVSNLEQIKNNQYALYEELQDSNAMVRDILSSVKSIEESAGLTAYFSRVTALAETSPKIYISSSI